MFDENLIFQQDNAPPRLAILVKIGLKSIESRTVLEFHFSNLPVFPMGLGFGGFFQKEAGFAGKTSAYFQQLSRN